MSFKYDKEKLFKEFDVAKQKDIKLSNKLNTAWFFHSTLVLSMSIKPSWILIFKIILMKLLKFNTLFALILSLKLIFLLLNISVFNSWGMKALFLNKWNKFIKGNEIQWGWSKLLHTGILRP